MLHNHKKDPLRGVQFSLPRVDNIVSFQLNSNSNRGHQLDPTLCSLLVCKATKAMLAMLAIILPIMLSQLSYPQKRKNHIKKFAFANLLSLVLSFNTHSKRYKQLPRTTSLQAQNNNFIDSFSFLVGKPPSKLDVPLDLLQGTNLDPDRVKLECVYKASRDGWSAIDFHKCVDGRGSSIVVALSKSGKRFGGYVLLLY